MTTDEALMIEFQGGSRAAFEELFARYRDPLHGFFRRRLNSAERAEDLTQETFLAVIRASSRYEPRALVRTYLYGIAIRLVSAERRKQIHVASGAGFVSRTLRRRGFRPRAVGAARSRKARRVGTGGSDAARVRTAQLFRNCRFAAHSSQYGALPAIPGAHGIEELSGVGGHPCRSS